MIKDLIVKLMEEATAETEHKGWCDTELTTNRQTRDAKTEDVAKLTSEVEELTAEIAQLTQDMADLAAAMAEIDAAVAKATADRTDSKEKNQQTITEAKEAQVAVEQAMQILKEFYAKSAEATALLQRGSHAHAKQTPAEDAPETWEETPYKGTLTEGGSVIDFLEVILSDFAKLESDVSTAESAEENEVKHKEEKKVNKESDLQLAKEELHTTQEQLDKAIAYYEKLKPTCVDTGITYE